jgi:hypothetical protein
LTVKVGALNPTSAKDAVEVELVISHARHHLRRTNPDFETLLDALQTAQKQDTVVLVTERLDDHEIVDVRSLPNPLLPVEVLAPPPVSPGLLLAPVTPQQAQQLFDLVSAKTCCPASAPAPCIPFQYLMTDAGAERMRCAA